MHFSRVTGLSRQGLGLSQTDCFPSLMAASTRPQAAFNNAKNDSCIFCGIDAVRGYKKRCHRNMAPARTPAVAGSAAHNATAANCWNTGTCPHSQQCFVHFKTASAGLAQCRDKCPPNWLCETRVPETARRQRGAACRLPVRLRCGKPNLRCRLLVLPTSIRRATRCAT